MEKQPHVQGSRWREQHQAAVALIRGIAASQRATQRNVAARSAAALLEAHSVLATLHKTCKSKVEERDWVAAVEELYQQARTFSIKLPPLPVHVPDELMDFVYLHSTTPLQPGAVAQATSGRGDLPGTERNLMIFLHGFGGRRQGFVDLAKSMRLPKTAFLLLNAPHELEEELLDDPPGYSWFTMLDSSFEFIEPRPQERRRLIALEQASTCVEELLQSLVSKCGWASEELFLFGYGQGGTVALDWLIRPPSCSSGDLSSIGAVVGVATEVLPERMLQDQQMYPSKARCEAVLLIHGDRDALTPLKAAQQSARHLQEAKVNVKLEVFADRGGEMLRGWHAEESRCVMAFLSDYLHGVGRKGSEEAMQKLGAEPVAVAEVQSWLMEMD